jgi:hypothetical protein
VAGADVIVIDQRELQRTCAGLHELSARLGRLATQVERHGGTLLAGVRKAGPGTEWTGVAARAFRARLTTECTGVEAAARRLRAAAEETAELAAALAGRGGR